MRLTAVRARAWLARTFAGLTWKWFAIFCGAVIFVALHQATLVGTIMRSPDALQKALAPLRAIVFAFVCFLPVLFAVIAAENRGPKAGWQRIACLVLALAAGQAAGMVLWMAVTPWVYWGVPTSSVPPSHRLVDSMEKLRSYGGRSLWYFVYSATAVALYYFLKAGRDAVAQLHREEVGREEIERENAEARLQVMQAQIEPHFLFNALASVRRLYQTDRRSGKSMLQHLRRYLTASLPSMREANSTLERELALATAYLSVQKIRMGRRLAFEVDVPAALRPLLVPPMMIATLVENAVIHGLSPLEQGGRVWITARQAADRLRIEVVDNGKGLEESWGGGVGLANIRSRLQSMFGEDADLALAPLEAGGVVASLEFPLQPGVEAKAA